MDTVLHRLVQILVAGHQGGTLLVEDRVNRHPGDPQTPGSQDPVADLCWAQFVSVGLVDQLALLLARQGSVFLAKDTHDLYK